MLRKPTGYVLAVACAVALSAGGCAGGKVTRIHGEQEFRKVVLESEKPVLVDFYKGGCATCVPLDGVMDQLVDEYEGRVTIAKFETMTAFFGIPSREIKNRYDIVFYPTAVLFVEGQVKKRWIMRYSIEGYRKEIDKHVTATTQPSGSAKVGPKAEPEIAEKREELY